jgi:hypothetical protein
MKPMSLNAARPEDTGREFQGIQGMSEEELKHEVLIGGRFVCYWICFSALLFTCKRPSKTCLVRAGGNRTLKGLPFTLLTLVAGWWGVPWGPIYTIQCLAKNLSGGEDITARVAPAAYVAARITGKRAMGAGPVKP